MPMYDHHIMGWVIFLSLLVAFMIGLLIIVRAAPARGGEGRGKSAVDLLDERYAKCEISRKDYLVMKKDLLGE